MIRFEEDFLFVDKKKLLKKAAEKNCRWKKRPLMVAAGGDLSEY
jgi:hypothetical protein